MQEIVSTFHIFKIFSMLESKQFDIDEKEIHNKSEKYSTIEPVPKYFLIEIS